MIKGLLAIGDLLLVGCHVVGWWWSGIVPRSTNKVNWLYLVSITATKWAGLQHFMGAGYQCCAVRYNSNIVLSID
jgi:hypothetical protein